jgi:hypothetical protein
MVEHTPNLRVLKPSREKRIPGDYFAYEMPDGIRRFGRLVAREVGVGFDPDPAQHLVYFYNCDDSGEFDPESLNPHSLLVPPLVVNAKPWTLGYFERVARIPLVEGDVLPRHTFYSVARDRYLDESGSEVPKPIGECGAFGLHSYLTVDDELSNALGFEVAPEKASK